MKTILLPNFFLLLSIISLIGQDLTEQIKLRDGTVKIGLIEKSRQFPFEIKFKAENQKSVQVVTPTEILSIWDDFEHYESNVVVEGDTPIFTKVLVKGTVSLYAGGKNFYVEKEGQFYKLSKKDEELDEGIRQDKKYIGMAKFLFFDCLKKSNKEWETLRFNAKTFEDLVKEYNQCKYPEGNITNYSESNRKLNKGFYLEGLSTTISRDMRFAPKPSFAIGGFVKIFSKNFLEIQIGLQLSVRNAERTITQSLNPRTINHIFGTLEIPMLIQKRIIRTNFNNGVYINGGPVFGTNLFKNTKIKYVNPDLTQFGPDENLYGSGFYGGRIGIGYLHRLKNRDLSINYFFERAFFGVGTNIQNQGIRIAHIF